MPHYRGEDRQAVACRIRAEMEEDERRQARPMYRSSQKYNDYYDDRPRAQAQPRYMNGPIFDAPEGYVAYPDYNHSPRYEPQRRIQAQPREQARPARGGNRIADRARALAAQMPLEGSYAQSPAIDLHGPTIREVPHRNAEHPKYRETKPSAGRKETYKLIRNIGEGGQG